MTTEDWHEVGRQVFRRPFDPCDVTVTVIPGADGVAVVDTRCSPAEAREPKDLIRLLAPLQVRRVVDTHAHFDHAWATPSPSPRDRIRPPGSGRTRPCRTGCARTGRTRSAAATPPSPRAVTQCSDMHGVK